jgi:hypothetical protein
VALRSKNWRRCEAKTSGAAEQKLAGQPFGAAMIASSKGTSSVMPELRGPQILSTSPIKVVKF